MWRWLAQGLLWCLGWGQIGTETLRNLSEHPRAVVLFAHTSYLDFYLFLLYRASLPADTPVKVLMKPQPFRYAGPLLRCLGAIPATRREDSGQGAVSRIVSQLDPLPRFLLCLSPKGTIMAAPWRSGYYYLSQQLQLPVIVAGLDYQQKRLRAFPALPPVPHEEALLPVPEVNQLLQEQMKAIVPLYPQREGLCLPVQSVVDWERLVVLAGWLVVAAVTLCP
jgi:1-acyl-sn-glycerol-3-phosphate acyltransferase